MVKNPLANAGDVKRCRFNPWIEKIPWKRAWQPTPVPLPRESLGWRRLAGYSHRVTKSRKQLKRLSLHTHTHTHTQNTMGFARGEGS